MNVVFMKNQSFESLERGEKIAFQHLILQASVTDHYHFLYMIKTIMQNNALAPRTAQTQGAPFRSFFSRVALRSKPIPPRHREGLQASMSHSSLSLATLAQASNSEKFPPDGRRKLAMRCTQVKSPACFCNSSNVQSGHAQ